MRKDGILAFDLGTSGVKCAVFDQNGKTVASAYERYQTLYPSLGRHEQRPAEWINGIINGCRALEATLSQVNICAVGVSGHSLGAVPVDKSGELLAQSVPIWSDSRAVKQSEEFFKKIEHKVWYEKTGNGFPAELYALFKIMWYKTECEDIYDRAVKFIGTKDYVNLFLTENVATDTSYASGSGAYLLQEGRYSEEYISAAGISAYKLPQICASDEIIGHVCPEAAKLLGIKSGTPVVAGGVDNACMALGAGCFREGDSYASLGSSAWITVSSDKSVVDFDKGIYTFAHCVEGQFIPSVGVMSFGSALAWVADNLFSELCGVTRFDDMAKFAMCSEVGANGILFNPCLAGGSATEKNSDITGGFMNLSLRNKREDIARAAFEGIAMQLYSAAEPLLDEIGDRLLVVGGGSKGEFARKVYADVFGKQIAVSGVQQDAAALGAAALAAKGCGLWQDYGKINECHGEMSITYPENGAHKAYEAMLPLYKIMSKACSGIGAKYADMKGGRG